MQRAANGQIVANTRRVNGQRERLCFGPSHDKPTWLPETEKYFFPRRTGQQAGTFVSKCRLCSNWTRVKSPGLAGWVPDIRVRPFVTEGVHKVGMSEFARRVNLQESRLKQIMEHPHRNVQKKVVRRIMLEVISIRRKGEVRHRDSIKAGHLARGRAEKKVLSAKDLYMPIGDADREREVKRSKKKRSVLSPEQKREESRKRVARHERSLTRAG